MSAKEQSPAAQVVKTGSALTMRHDPYTRLLAEKSTTRIEAAVSLVQDLNKHIKNELATAKETGTEVKLSQNGISMHLEYALGRLIAGLESTDRFATIGFSTALSMLLSHFVPDHIPAATFEKMVLARHTSISYGGLLTKEQQSFDLGCLFLIQTLDRVNLLSEMTTALIEKLLVGVSRLARRNPQMNDLCVGTVIKLTQQQSHSQIILQTLTSFIPKPQSTTSTSNATKNKHVPEELALWDAGTITAALALLRLGQQSAYETQFPGFFTDVATFPTIWALLVPTLAAYPIIPAVWVQLLSDALQLPGHFEAFVTQVIIPNLADNYDYNRRGIAMTIITDFIQYLMDTEKENQKVAQEPQYTTTTLQFITNTLFSAPTLVKTAMDHARMPGTPLYLQSVTMLATLESFCAQFKALIPTILSIFGDPNKGGSRSFDAKSKTKFMASVAAMLDKDELMNYIETTIANFHNAETTIAADIRHVAQLTKERQESAETSSANADGAEEDKKKNTAADASQDAEETIKTSLSKTDLSKITDVDEFMKTDIAKRTLQQGIAALQLWTVDQVYHLCELLFRQQRTLQHTASKHRQESKLKQQQQQQPQQQESEQETKPKAGKGKKGAKAEAVVDESEDSFSIDSAKMESCLQNCIVFLYTHAYYKPSSSTAPSTSPSTTAAAKKGKKGAKKAEDLHNITIQPVSRRCQEVCSQRFISLFSTLLLADGHYHPHTALSLQFGAEETRWGCYLLTMDTKLRKEYDFTPIVPQQAQLTKAVSDVGNTISTINDWIEKMMGKYKKDKEELKADKADIAKITAAIKFSKTYIDLAVMLKYVITTAFALLYSDVDVLAPIVSDLRFITYGVQQDFLEKAPRGTKLTSTISLTEDELEMLKDDEDTPWVDVLLDLLLSVIGLGHSVTRAVVLKSFKIIVPHLKMSSITLLIDPIAQAVEDEEGQGEEQDAGKNNKKNKGPKDTMRDDDLIDFSDEEEDSEIDDDEDNEDSDFSDMTDDENEELGDVIRKLTQGGVEIDVDGGMDDGEESEEEIDATDTANILLDNKSSLISQEQEDAISGIIRLQKEHHKQQKNKVEAAMLMKLRILDLVDVLISEMFATNTWLSLLLPMIVLIKNTRNQALGALQTKAIGLFKSKLCSNTITTDFLSTQRRALNLTETDHFSNYITVSDDVVNPETLIQPQDLAHGDNIQAILEAIFDSLSSPQGETAPGESAQKTQTMESGATLDRTTMAGYALASVASLYLIAPAGPIEYSQVQPTAPKKTTKAKKSPSTTPVLTQGEIQTKIFNNRVAFFISGFLPLVQLQFVNAKRENFSASFFKLVCEAPIVAGAYMWQGETSIFNVLDAAVTSALTPFLRKQASETLGLIFKHYRFALLLNDKEELYGKLGKYYEQVYEKHQNSIVALQQAQAVVVPKQATPEQTQSKQPKKKGGNKNAKQQREANIAAAKAYKLGLQSLLEKSRSFVLNIESQLKITTSIIKSDKKSKNVVKETKQAKVATPVKKVQTPVKAKEMTPAKAKEMTPAKAKEMTPAKAKEMTPAKAKEMTPAKSKAKEMTPAKVVKDETPVKATNAAEKVATPTKATPTKATPLKKAAALKTEIPSTKATTSKKFSMLDSDGEGAGAEAGAIDDDLFDEEEVKVQKKAAKKAVVKVEEEAVPAKRGRPAKVKAEPEPEPETTVVATPRKRKTAPPVAQDDDEEETPASLATPRRSTRLRK